MSAPGGLRLEGVAKSFGEHRALDGVDLVIEAGPCRGEATTVIDLTSGTPELVREGRGSLAPFGL